MAYTYTQGFEVEQLGPEWTLSAYIAPDGTTANTGSRSLKLDGNLQGGATRFAELRLTVDAGATLDFARRVSSETSFDKLNIKVDGVQQGSSLSGTVAWGANTQISLAAGARVIRFEYVKDSTGNAGSDAAWIDDIQVANVSGSAPTAWSGASATRLYLCNDIAPATPSAWRGAWDKTATAPIGGADNTATKLLGAAKAGAVANVDTNRDSTAVGWDVAYGRWVSADLAAQTIAGLFNPRIAARDPWDNAHAATHLHLYVMAPDGSVRGTLLADWIGQTMWFQVGTGQYGVWDVLATLSSVAAQAGDRLVVEVGWRGIASGVNTGRDDKVGYGGTAGDVTAGAAQGSNSPWIEFDSAIAFAGAASPGRRPSPVWIGL